MASRKKTTKTTSKVAAKRTPSPRTASGKKANPALLASAQQEAQQGARERTEEGHLAAGRVPPSQGVEKRVSGATARVRCRVGGRGDFMVESW